MLRLIRLALSLISLPKSTVIDKIPMPPLSSHHYILLHLLDTPLRRRQRTKGTQVLGCLSETK